MSLGHVHVSALLFRTLLTSDWCTSHAAPDRLCSPARTNAFSCSQSDFKDEIKIILLLGNIYLSTGSEHDGLVLIIFQTEGRQQTRQI